MVYPMANFTNIGEAIVYASTVTDGVFWSAVLVGLFIISFAGLSFFSRPSRAFAASAFFIGTLGGFIWILGALDTLPTVVCFAAAIGGLIMLLFSED